jgi:hypothetical protein
MLGLTFIFYSAPVANGFGLISILSGIDRGSLDILAGTALSGELQEHVKLVINPFQDISKGLIEYCVTSGSTRATNRRLVKTVI